ncbi:MAG: antibiotic biosynthesis monooxygenase [Ktedonobacteraceae bacterium]|nr:antibiotic biosynthesis monooxygenase [Ktedonobacteraceae bacterium]
MSKFGLFGKITTVPGKRDELVSILLGDGKGVPEMEGCELYIVNISPTEPDVIWVMEVWESREAHAASLNLEPVKEAIKRGRPLIAGMEGFEMQPVGGKGLGPG